MELCVRNHQAVHYFNWISVYPLSVFAVETRCSNFYKCKNSDVWSDGKLTCVLWYGCWAESYESGENWNVPLHQLCQLAGVEGFSTERQTSQSHKKTLFTLASRNWKKSKRKFVVFKTSLKLYVEKAGYFQWMSRLTCLDKMEEQNIQFIFLVKCHAKHYWHQRFVLSPERRRNNTVSWFFLERIQRETGTFSSGETASCGEHKFLALRENERRPRCVFTADFAVGNIRPRCLSCILVTGSTQVAPTARSFGCFFCQRLEFSGVWPRAHFRHTKANFRHLSGAANSWRLRFQRWFTLFMFVLWKVVVYARFCVGRSWNCLHIQKKDGSGKRKHLEQPESPFRLLW